MADEDWADGIEDGDAPGADAGGEDDWDVGIEDEGAESGAGAQEDDADWDDLGDMEGADAEAMLAAGAPDEEKPAAAPKTVLDPTRAKHLQRQKKRAAEDERARDAAAAAMQEGPLDDPAAERARIERLQKERELEIMAETLGLGDDAAPAPAPTPAAAPAPAPAAAPAPAPSGAAAAVGMPSSTAECVRVMPIAGKAWTTIGGMLIDRAEDSKSKQATGKLIKGVMRAAVTKQVLDARDIAELKKMLEQAEANVSIAATAKAQGRKKKKPKAKLGRSGQKVAGGKSGYTNVASDADLMGMGASGIVEPEPAPAVAVEDDDDDFM